MVETVTISKKDYENLLKSNQKTIDELNKFKKEFEDNKKRIQKGNFKRKTSFMKS